MADIDLERNESSSVWPWILGLAVVAFLAWGIAEAFDADDAAVAGTSVETYETDDFAASPDSEPLNPSPTSSVALVSIMNSPDLWVGRTLPADVYSVADVPTDRGFWITEDDARLMALIIDQPSEEPVDINEGAMLRITGGTLRDPSYLPELPGSPATEETLTMARDQEVFLVVDERNVSIVDHAGG